MGKSSYREKSREKRLAGQVSLALAAGMFSVVPVAHGMPTVDTSQGAHADYTTKPVAVGNTMEVQGTQANNVIDWKDFSIKSGETVAFKDVGEQAANYMNIVTGHATSNIEGTMTNNGDIYLINPNGVIFGKTAQVNVGNLYVSTREASQVAIDTFRNAADTPLDGTILAANLMDSALKADVVNLIDEAGYVKANKVVMEGKNIRFLNASSVADATAVVTQLSTKDTDGNPKFSITKDANDANSKAHPAATSVILRSDKDGYIHVGDEEKNYNYTAQTITASATQSARKFNNASGVNYALIHDAADLGKINNNTFHNPTDATSNKDLTGNYMLANDIDASTMTEAIGNNSAHFKGKFDGNFYTVSNLTLSGNYLGLFGYTSNNARIENVGVRKFLLKGQNMGSVVGSIVGQADNTTILNVWNEGGSGTYIGLSNNGWGQNTGGLVGTLNASTLKNAYNAGAVHGAGVVSVMRGASTVENVYNVGETMAWGGSAIYGLIYQADSANNKIINSYSAAKYLNNTTGQESWGTTATHTNSYIINSATSYSKDKGAVVNNSNTLTKDLYAAWSIDSEGGKNTTWRIYERASLPLLTSFMKAKGTVAAEYTYDKNGTSTKSVDDSSSKVYSATKVNPADIVLYGAKETVASLKQTDDTKAENLTGKQFAVSTRQNVYVDSHDNASAFALLYGGQQGYDLYGNNFTIARRAITFTPSDASKIVFEKTYDNSADASTAVMDALRNAGAGSTYGFIGSDADYVTPTVKNITATYYDTTFDEDGSNPQKGAINANAGDKKTMHIDASNAIISLSTNTAKRDTLGTQAAKDEFDRQAKIIQNNYIVNSSDVANMTGDYYNAQNKITPRKVTVQLHVDSDIDKIYDGTSDVYGKVTKSINGEDTEIDLSGAGNIQVFVDTTGMMTEGNDPVINGAFKTMIQKDFGVTTEVTSNELSSTYLGNVAANYVKAPDANGVRAVTANVADTANMTEHVAYTGLKLGTTAAGSGNYKFVDKLGNDLAGDATNGYTLLASGQINPRTLSKSDLSIGGTGSVSKDYDGTTDKTGLGTTTPATFGTVRTTLEAARASDTGILKYTDGTVNDKDKLTFTPTGTATFYDYENPNLATSTATQYADDGVTVNGGAYYAKYNVTQGRATGVSDDNPVLTNYVWDNGYALSTTDGQYVAAGGTAGSGRIDRRNITVTLGMNGTLADIDKTYDGTTDVGATYTTWGDGTGAYARYASESTDTHLVTIADAITGTVAGMDVSAAYAIQSGSQEANPEDVALAKNANNELYVPLDTDDEALKNAKDVIYTFKIDDDDLAKNYTINGNKAETGTTLTATGRIKQKDLSDLVSFSDAQKYYDGTAAVDVYDTTDPAAGTVRPVLTVTENETAWTTEAVNAVFDMTKIAGTYGTKTETSTGTTFTPDANASDTKKDVLYTGLTTNEQGETVPAALKYALKSNNYKISNTAYGKGLIQRRNINLADLKTWTSPENNPQNSVTAEYAGKGTDGKKTFTNTSSATTFTATGYINKDKMTQIIAGDRDAIAARISIAEAIYNGAPGGSTLLAGEVGNYEGKVNLAFNFDVTGLTNYTVDYATTGNEFTSASNTRFTQNGYTGEITPKGVTVTVQAAGKTYDGTKSVKNADGVVFDGTDNTFKSWFTVIGKVDNDAVAVTGEALYDDANADADGSTPSARITYSNLALDNSNYKIVDSQGATINSITGIGTINKRHVVVTSVGDVNKTYDGDAQVKLNITGSSTALDIAFANATRNDDGLAIPGTITALGDVQGNYGDLSDSTFNTNANVNRTSGGVTPAGKRDIQYTGVSDALGSNYVLDNGTYVQTDSETGTQYVYGKGTINAANKNVTVTKISKKYDGTATISKENLTFADGTDSELIGQITIANGSTAVYGDYGNAGENNIAGILVLQHNETDALGNTTYNYNVTMGAVPAKGTVTPRTIYAHLVEDANTPLTKIYDGTDAVKQTVTSWVKLKTDEGDSLLGTDGVSFAYTDNSKVKYANANANESGNKVVNFTEVGLTNNDAGNYQLILKQKNGSTTTLNKNETGILTTTGTINRRVVSVTSFGNNPEERAYNGSSYVTDAAIDALRPTLEQALYDTTSGELSNDTGVLAEDSEKLAVNKGQLKGVYGSWDTSGDFIADPHAGDEKDVLYYNVALTGTAATNYKLAESPVKTIFSENDKTKAAPIASTVYFQEAAATGTITPLTLTMGNLRDNWVAPTKTYDGTAFVTDAEGNVLALNSDDTALGQYYKIQWSYTPDGSDTPITGYIPYTVTEASYDNKNAGDGNKTVTLKGFSFDSRISNDISIDVDTLLNGDANYPAVSGFKNGRSIDTASIARRVISVSADDVDHTKVYDGSQYLNGTYDVGKLAATQNDAKTQALVGTDQVSVTYVANFDDKTATLDPTQDATDSTLWTKDVTYTFTLSDSGASKNYRLETPTTDANERVKEITGEKGAIIRKTVKVAWKDGEGTNLDKTYDGSASLIDNSGKLLVDGNTTNQTLADITLLTDAAGAAGVIEENDDVVLNATAVYLNKNGTAASANSNEKDGTTVNTRKVLVQNLNLTGTDGDNYYIVTTKLTGNGDIKQRQVAVELSTNAPTTKVYDRSESLNGYSADDIITGAVDGVPASGIVTGDNLELSVESAIYYDADNNPTYDAGGGLGVSYRLKWSDANYTLVKVPLADLDDKKFVKESGNLVGYGTLNTDGVGTITPKTISMTGTPTITKTYDGNNSVTNTPNLVTNLFGDSVYDSDKATLLTNVVGTYDSENTNADADKKEGNLQRVTLTYDLDNNGRGKNYQFNVENRTDTDSSYTATATHGEYTNNTGGRIDRAQVTLTPNNVTYSTGDNIPTDGYTGSTSSTGAAYNGAVTFGRDGNTSTAVGNYTLLGYVNGQQVGTNNTFIDGIGNYYFVTAPNQALHVEAKADVADAVHRDTIADKKFIPDDYSYNRMSQDEDLTRLKRESQATVQYTEKGVNTDESSQGGLLASMDIQGAGSVVNLNGAVIRTSAVPEKPEEIAAEAALPVSEASEADFSSIDVENIDESDGSQSMLEVLTNASNNAENRGTSIVINTMDEDEEDAEEEKSRRALIVDRSNIGIETLGDAVNLDQMIG